VSAGSEKIPTGVLSDALADAIDRRRVRAAVFTTFSFDPAFFEMEILPILFDQQFSHVDKVKAVQLEDALREIDGVAVYYDRSALSQDAAPARLDVRRIDVRRATGVFHPKVVLLLVDERVEESEAPSQSLIVGILSANLTRSGWWENVEVGHFEEISGIDEQRVSFRRDLLSLVRRIKSAAPADQEHDALERIRSFLLRETLRQPHKAARYDGRWYTRIFAGQSALADWLTEFRLRPGNLVWNLEVISPYFDAEGADTLQKLADAVDAREIRVYLPRHADGTPLVTEDAYRSIAEIASWCELPGGVVRASGRAEDGGERTRRVHAKVYRLWGKHAGNLALVGSANLTRAAHSGGNAGNLEASIFVDISEQVPKRWWLEPIDREPETFLERAPEHSHEPGERVLDVGLRYDWGRDELWYRCHDRLEGPLGFAEPGGRDLFTIDSPVEGEWVRCPADARDALRTLLESTSFVQVRHGADRWRILVREDGMSHRPSLLSKLTPEEILRYWSLLTPEQRQAFIEQRLGAGAPPQGLPIGGRTDPLVATDTLFDRFGGLFHAFNRLRETALEALAAQRYPEVDARLLGAKYDSLPVLLQGYLDRDDADPVLVYVAFLCAQQLWNRVRKDHRDYLRERKRESRTLTALLDCIPDLRTAIPLDGDPRQTEFLEWYEEMFLAETVVPEETAS